MAAWKTRELFWVIAGDWTLNMDRKDSDVHDNFFASLNQLILSLEPAIKEAGSVAAAEDILTHLEATDENFHRFVLTHWHVSKLTAFHLNIFVLLEEFRLKQSIAVEHKILKSWPTIHSVRRQKLLLYSWLLGRPALIQVKANQLTRRWVISCYLRENSADLCEPCAKSSVFIPDSL